MTAPLKSVALCYAPADIAAAREIGDLLEANCGVRADYGHAVTRPGLDLIAATAAGISADIAIVLLSPESVPPKWDRARWEPVFIDQPRELGTQLACVCLGDCRFPPLLRRRNFFDLRWDPAAAARAVKRWVLQTGLGVQQVTDLPPADGAAADPDVLAELERCLADRPGSRANVAPAVAIAFGHTHAGDFEGAFWISCAGRTAAGVLGDTAGALGLRLSGSVEQNRAALCEFCAQRRCLLVFDDLAAEHEDLVRFGGRASILITAPQGRPARRDAAEVERLFASWTREREACLRVLGDAWLHLLDLGPRGGRLGWSMAALLKNEDWLAEAHEVLEFMEGAERAAGNPLRAAELAWEKSWILEHWGEPLQLTGTPRARAATQLALPFSTH